MCSRLDLAMLLIILCEMMDSSSSATIVAPPFPWIVDTTKDLLDDTQVWWASLIGLLNHDAPH